MKKTTGFLLLAVFSLLTTVTVLHGCGGKESPTPTPTPTQAKFTIVGSGS